MKRDILPLEVVETIRKTLAMLANSVSKDTPPQETGKKMDLPDAINDAMNSLAHLVECYVAQYKSEEYIGRWPINIYAYESGDLFFQTRLYWSAPDLGQDKDRPSIFIRVDKEKVYIGMAWPSELFQDILEEPKYDEQMIQKTLEVNKYCTMCRSERRELNPRNQDHVAEFQCILVNDGIPIDTAEDEIIYEHLRTAVDAMMPSFVLVEAFYLVHLSHLPLPDDIATSIVERDPNEPTFTEEELDEYIYGEQRARYRAIIRALSADGVKIVAANGEPIDVTAEELVAQLKGLYEQAVAVSLSQRMAKILARPAEALTPEEAASLAAAEAMDDGTTVPYYQERPPV